MINSFELAKYVEKANRDIKSDKTILDLLHKKIELLSNSKPTYIIENLEVKTKYPLGVVKLIKEIDENILQRKISICKHYADLIPLEIPEP